MRAKAIFPLIFLALTGCGALQPGQRPLVYDFGPGALAPVSANRMADLPALALAGVQAVSALDNTAVWYRLAYSDAQQLRPYAYARWSMAPAELLRQRLRDQLGQRRAVLNPADGVLATRQPLTLRVELEEFSQIFDTAATSVGLVRVRATLGQAGPGVGSSERLVAQRSFVVQRPSPSLDAPGGVRALTAAADAVIQDIDQWVQQTQSALP